MTNALRIVLVLLAICLIAGVVTGNSLYYRLSYVWLGLLLISWGVVERLAARPRMRFPGMRFALAMGLSVLLVTFLHALEAIIWTWAYVWLGALPDYRIAMLFSLNAITAYGHANIYLEPHWQMLGALEALNGMMLFGLTTAFLFAVVRRVSPTGGFSGRG